MTPAPERPDTVNRSKPVYGLTGRMREKRGLPDDGVSGVAVTPAPERPDDVNAAMLLMQHDEHKWGCVICGEYAAPVTDAGLRELADGINAAVTLRLIGGNTDQTYTPNEVAVMVHEVVEQQYAALSRQAEKETA